MAGTSQDDHEAEEEHGLWEHYDGVHGGFWKDLEM
jgi:hypothetical protein